MAPLTLLLADQKKHFQHIALLSLMAMVALRNLIVASPYETVDGADILGWYGDGFGLWNWLLRSSIIKWQIPFFNPYVCGGRPFLGNPQTSVYYPTTLLSVVCPNEHVAIRLSIVIHAAICGVSMYLLLVRWKQRPEASLIGATGFMLSGEFFGRIVAGHLTFVYGITWIPLTLILYEIAIQKRKAKYVALAALPLSLQIQSGGIIIFFHTAFVLSLFSAYLALTHVSSRHTPEKLFKMLGKEILGIAPKYIAILLLALIFSAVRVFAYVEVAQYTLLPGRSGPLDTSLHMRGGHTAENLFSDFVGISGQGGCERYLGLLLLSIPLAIFCAPFMKRKRRQSLIVFLVFLTGISLLFSMGTHLRGIPILGSTLLFLLELVHIIFPFFRLLRELNPFLIIVSFSVPALATIVTTMFEESKLFNLTARTKRILVYAIVFLIFADLTMLEPHGLTVETTEGIFDGHRLYKNPAIEFMLSEPSFDNPYRIYSADPPNVYFWAKNGFECLQGRALDPVNYMRFLRRAQADPSAKMLGMLNVKYVVADHEMSSHGLSLVHKSRDKETKQKVHVYYNNYYLPRLQPVDHAMLVIAEDEELWETAAQQIIGREEFDPRTTALVWGRSLSSFSIEELRRYDAIFLPDSETLERNDPETINKMRNYTRTGGSIFRKGDIFSLLDYLEACSKSSAQIKVVQYDLNKLEAIVTSKSRTFVLISQTRIPGWRIYIDNRMSTYLPVNDIFMAIPFDGGSSRLTIEFKPLSFEIGALFSTFSHLILVVLFLHNRIRISLGKMSWLKNKIRTK